MLRRFNIYSFCFAFLIIILFTIAGNLYTENAIYQPSFDSLRNIRNYLRTEDGESDELQDDSLNIIVDGFANVDKIIETTRVKIKDELAYYNFSQSRVKRLENLLMEEGGQPIRSVILSTWRSGTTFLGDVLNAVPANFYHYEPLLSYDIIQIRGPPNAKKALARLKSMLKCKYNGTNGGMDVYFKYGSTHLHQFHHNTRLWDHCKHNKKLCWDPDFTERFCKLHPFQSMKVVRVRLSLMEQLLKDQKLKFKMVLLIRDPRAVMQSRHHRNFCEPSPDCWRPELLCADMISDYVAASRLLKKYPKRLTVLRYEELSMDPMNTTQSLFNFFGLSVSSSVDAFLRSHTTVEVAGVSSTFRVSQEVPFKWKDLLDFGYVEEVQRACRGAMEVWGYLPAHNASHMRSKDFNPLTSYKVEL